MFVKIGYADLRTLQCGLWQHATPLSDAGDARINYLELHCRS
jgi:hypothetical protein